MWREDLFTERLRLSAERGIITDWQDAWLLGSYTWYIDDYGYACLSYHIDGRKYKVYLHHCIMGVPIWEDEQIDHINRIPSDNRRENLRYATRSENLRNNRRRFTS